MKLKSTIFFIIIFTFASASFAQKSDPPKPDTAKAAAAAKLPTVKEILDRYVKALGGREAIEKVKSRTSTGTLELVPMNLKGTFETYAAPDAKSFSKMTIGGIGDMLEGTDGKTAWAVNPIQGNREKAGIELLQSKLINDFYRDVRLEKLFPKIELKGIEKVGEKDAYVVVATPDGVPAETWYFDTKTGLMLRSDITAVTPEGNTPMTVFYEDMRAVDGVMIPFRIRTQTPQFQIVMTATEVKHGTQVDEAKFAKPKQ